MKEPKKVIFFIIYLAFSFLLSIFIGILVYINMERETLRVVWKFIRRSGYASTRTPETYCTYIVKNKNHDHKLKTIEGSKLFEILKNTTVSESNDYEYEVLVDGVYKDNKLIYVTNFRKI
jgi:hypothetical protein